MKARFVKHTLKFKQPSGTSRGILRTKDSWFLILEDGENLSIGECSIIEGLNPEMAEEVEIKLQSIVNALNDVKSVDPDIFINAPSVKFAYEMALRDHKNGAIRELYKTNFLEGKGIPINGLIWMGKPSFMLSQIKKKINEGYNCLKLKIAAIDFEEEIELLQSIRNKFKASDLEIRVDANGGFSNIEARTRLQRLSKFDIHSIEQPIAPGQWEEMAKIVYDSPIPIALDEELISIESTVSKNELIETIKPHYIILKPSLLGGFSESEEWIDIANKNDIKWWITSALESNIGLSAITQWTSSLDLTMKHQGLGTGQLYNNNIPSPLYIDKGNIYHGKDNWDLNLIGC
ncbi:o-succinylbenzoate synthase [Saprospiraceae bacterium]|nr:o-succinylbenzoate synthase [Saprospiraceae bacterium]